MISYVNGRGKRVVLEVKRHAVFAFQERFERLFNRRISCAMAQRFIELKFADAQRVKNINYKERRRVKRHGHTLYFREGDFTFVVHNAVVITVEISRNGFRGLN
jgi:hypothetical protein